MLLEQSRLIMAVYIVTTETFPNGMAATARIRCYAKAIAYHEKCMVLIPNRLEDIDNPLGNTSTKGFLNGYSYKYFGKSTAKPKNLFLQRFKQLHDVFCLLLFLLKNLQRKDSVIFYSYDLFLGKLTSKVAHLKDAYIFFELCEHPHYQCKGYPKEVGEDKQLHWVRRQLNNYDGFFVISHSLQEYIEKCFNGNKRTLLIPILFEKPIEKGDGEVLNEGTPYIIHTGALSQRKDGIINSLKAFGVYASRNGTGIDYLLTGDLDNSPDRDEILQVLNHYNISSKVRFLGFLSPEDIIKYQKNAYMTIISKENNLQNNYCFATKIAEYLNAGCLLIMTEVGEVKYYFKNGKNCLFFKYGDIRGLADLIEDVVMNKKKKDEIAQEGKKTADEKFYCMNYSKAIIKFVKKI